MKTLEEHNKEIISNFIEMNTKYPRPNDIACPKCDKEMYDLDDTVLCSNPPQKNIGCVCGYRDYRYC